MSGEAEGRSGTGSLEDVRDVDVPDRSLASELVEKLNEHRLVVALVGALTVFALVEYYRYVWTLVPHIWAILFVDVLAIAYLLVRIRSVLGTLWVLGITTGALYFMDGGISIDVLIFGVLTVLIAGYFLVTLWNDIRMG